MVNSDTGKEFWDETQDIITAEPIDITNAIPRNRAIIKPVTKPEGRKIFFDSLDKYDFNELIKRCIGREKLLRIRIKGCIGEERIRSIKSIIRNNT